MEQLNFLIKACVILSSGQLIYFLILRHLTFFKLNRIYLLGILFLSILIPLIHISIKYPPSQHYFYSSIIDGIKSDGEQLKDSKLSQVSETVSTTQTLKVIYLIVTAIFLTKTIFGVLQLLFKKRKMGVKYENYTIVNSSNGRNYSFFNILFLHKDKLDPHELTQVLLHEQQHARMFHSVDKIIVELFIAFFWFNPFIYMIRKSLTQLHEYQVDEVIGKVFKPKIYAGLILKLTSRLSPGLTSYFGDTEIKDRLRVLFKPRSSSAKKTFYLISIPVLALFTYLFSIQRVFAYNNDASFTVILDAGHGGVQSGAVFGGVSEKDLNLSLAKLIANNARAKGIKILFTRESDNTVSLEDRIKIKGDILLSIHHNSSLVHSDDHGSELLIGHRFPDALKLAELMKERLLTLNGLNSPGRRMIFQTEKGNYLLSKSSIPALILEVGYLSNSQDLDYITNSKNCELIAQKITEALVVFAHQKK